MKKLGLVMCVVMLFAVPAFLLTGCFGGGYDLDRPANVTLEGNVLSWDDVDGALTWHIRSGTGNDFRSMLISSSLISVEEGRVSLDLSRMSGDQFLQFEPGSTHTLSVQAQGEALSDNMFDRETSQWSTTVSWTVPAEAAE